MFSVLVLLLASVCGTAGEEQSNGSSSVTFPDLYEASIAELQAGLTEGHFTSVDLVKVCDPLEDYMVSSNSNSALFSRHTLRG